VVALLNTDHGSLYEPTLMALQYLTQ